MHSTAFIIQETTSRLSKNDKKERKKEKYSKFKKKIKKKKKVRKCETKKTSLIIGNTMLLSLVSIIGNTMLLSLVSIMQNNDTIFMPTVPTVVTCRVWRL
jgi:hypothetical protein